MLEISPLAVVVLDRMRNVLFANERLCAMVGYSREELVGQPVTMILPGTPSCDDVAQSVRLMSRARTPEPVAERGEEQILIARPKNGPDIFVSVCEHAIDAPDESLWLAHLMPADDRLVNEEYVKTERMFAIKSMISGLAHESRNALQRAMACLDLLELDFNENPEQMILTQQIRDSLSDLLKNYDEVRRYAEPVAITPQPISLLSLCQIAFEELIADVDNQGLTSRQTTWPEVAGSQNDAAPNPSDLIDESPDHQSNRTADRAEPAENRVAVQGGFVRLPNEDVSIPTSCESHSLDKAKSLDRIRAADQIQTAGEIRSMQSASADTVDRLRVPASHRLEIASAFPPADVVQADKEKMKMVFKQIFSNAIDACDDAVHIHVACVPEPIRDREGVRITVRDHGPGFATDSLGQIFEPFFTTKLRGSGLGLAICRRVVEAHNGMIQAINHENGGAMVVVKLPVDAKATMHLHAN